MSTQALLVVLLFQFVSNAFEGRYHDLYDKTANTIIG